MSGIMTSNQFPANDNSCVLDIEGTFNVNDYSYKNETNAPTGGNYGNFNGIDSYLSIPDSSDWDFGTGDFTIEGWIYYTLPTVSASSIIFEYGALQSGNLDGYTFFIKSNGALGLIRSINTSWDESVSSTTILSDKTWYHVAVVRSSGTIKLYINGTEDGSLVSSNTYGSNVTGVVRVGAYSTPVTAVLNGKLDELRISDTARYTAAFTPSTTEFTSDVNTMLLLHFNGANASTTFTDSGNTGHTVTSVDNAIMGCGHGVSNNGVTVDTGTTNLNHSSLSFNGTTDYLSIVDSDDFDFGTGDFTIQMWMYFDNTSATYTLYGQGVDGDNRVKVFWSSSGVLAFSLEIATVAVTTVSSTFTPTLSTWYHLAVVRKDGVITIYVDGIDYGGGTESRTISQGGNVTISAGLDGVGVLTQYFPGNLQDVMIHNRAIYTRGFIPPNRIA